MFSSDSSALSLVSSSVNSVKQSLSSYLSGCMCRSLKYLRQRPYSIPSCIPKSVLFLIVKGSLLGLFYRLHREVAFYQLLHDGISDKLEEDRAGITADTVVQKLCLPILECL